MYCTWQKVRNLSKEEQDKLEAAIRINFDRHAGVLFPEDEFFTKKNEHTGHLYAGFVSKVDDLYLSLFVCYSENKNGNNLDNLFLACFGKKTFCKDEKEAKIYAESHLFFREAMDSHFNCLDSNTKEFIENSLGEVNNHYKYCDYRSAIKALVSFGEEVDKKGIGEAVVKIVTLKDYIEEKIDKIRMLDV